MIFGLETPPLPDGIVVMEAVAIVKALDEDGHAALYTRSTDGLASWDRIGMLMVALDLDREFAQDCFTDEGAEEGEGDE